MSGQERTETDNLEVNQMQDEADSDMDQKSEISHQEKGGEIAQHTKRQEGKNDKSRPKSSSLTRIIKWRG